MQAGERVVAGVTWNHPYFPPSLVFSRYVFSQGMSIKILVADDNRVGQRITEAMLQSLGYEVHICTNGQDAIEACLTGDFALILMDGYMPVMDGFEAAREIRRRERGRRTPIVALTAGRCGTDCRRCFDAGMDAYLSKPVSLDRLAGVVDQWKLCAEPVPQSVVIP
jgi:CheY-like chemotaxis protein